MDLLFLSLSLILPIITLVIIFYAYTSKPHGKPNLPPGSFGLPFIGETYQFLFQDPEKFLKDRMQKHSAKVFKTYLFGEPMVVLCGTSGHKFIASNEGKHLTAWRPVSMQKLFRSSYQKVKSATVPIQSEAHIVKAPVFIKPEALAQYAAVMDTMTKQHFETHWVGKSHVEVYSLLQLLIVGIATKLYMGLDDPKRVAKIAVWMDHMSQVLHVIPFNIFGTSFARAKKAADAVREEILMVIKEKKAALAKGEKPRDILSYMIVNTDPSGRFMPENEIADKAMGLVAAAFNSPSIVLTYVMKYLGEMPQVYDNIRAEQLEIASSKNPGEPLNWEDIQKMKYSWNVLMEIMRLVPPLQGTFREALTDFTYEGYSIPKGWKIYWTISSTNKDPEYFPEPEKFDPARFENELPRFLNVPFGGGPRVCPGKDYARLQMLTYLHHLVRFFKWETINFNPKVLGSMNPIPVEGLQVRLQQYAK